MCPSLLDGQLHKQESYKGVKATARLVVQFDFLIHAATTRAHHSSGLQGDVTVCKLYIKNQSVMYIILKCIAL